MNGKKQTKIPYKFSSRFIFSDTLPRIMRIIEDEKNFENMIMQTNLPYVFSDENIPLKFTYTINQASVSNSFAEVTFVLNNEKIRTSINVIFNFTENTLENTVLAVVEINFTKRELIPLEYTNKIIDLFPGISADIISNLDKMLQEDKKDIYHYLSKIFNYSREKIFDVITNMHKILMEKHILNSFLLYNKEGLKDNDDVLKEGSTLTFFFENCEKEVKMKINRIKKDENDKKWILEFLPLDVEFKEILVQFKLIKLENDKTLVCQINKFSEHIESDVNEHLNEKKIRAFNFIEEELKSRYDS